MRWMWCIGEKKMVIEEIDEWEKEGKENKKEGRMEIKKEKGECERGKSDKLKLVRVGTACALGVH